jgi:fatty acid desaturase
MVNYFTFTNVSVDIRSYINRQKLIWNAVAITYTFVGYVAAIFLLMLHQIWCNGLGVILLTHSLLYSAYLTHEFMHGTIFKNRRWNTIVGNVMLWLNGGCYNGFQDLTLQHIAHHKDRVDIFTFDPIVALGQKPLLIRRSILLLEWLYFPAIGFWSRWRSILSPWWNSERRDRRIFTTLIIAIRGILFILLGLISFKALLLYFFSYLGMMIVMRWADAFQHTYEGFPPGTVLPKRDRAHEETNTFSTLLSRRYPLLNLLLLNFGYHCAHHSVMKCPWHSLHELDRELYRDKEVRYISLFQQLKNYHQFRVIRFIEGQGQAVDEKGNPTPDKFYGAHDVSFLMLY